MLNNIQSQFLNYAAQAGAWVQTQIAVAQTSQYGIVRFLATNATPKTALVSAIGGLAVFCFGKALQNYVQRNSYLTNVPKKNQTIVKNNGFAYASEHDINTAKTLRESSKTSNRLAVSHNKWAKGWAIAGVALTATAVAVAILMPSP